VLASVEQFVETGNFEYLNPVVGLVAAELQRARDDNWKQATPVPARLLNAMPVALHRAVRRSRYLLVKRVQDLSLPAFAIEHFKKATGVVAIDLVFFKAVLDMGTTAGRHYWLHELYHVTQYADKGVVGFAKEYVAGVIRGGLNPLEKEADIYACRHFPISRPAYIDKCP